MDRATLDLLSSSRVEVSMTVAAALLAHPERGVLASLVPETFLRGPSFVGLRQWLGRRFHSFETLPIERGKFQNQDLGLAALVAYRRSRLRGSLGASSFVGELRPPEPVALVAVRGSLCSSELSARGSIPVAHAGGYASADGYEVKACTKATSRLKSRVWAFPGDILVVRVGRRAGTASVLQTPSALVLTDCVFLLRAQDSKLHKRLQALAVSGSLTQTLTSRVDGLGAAFLRRADLVAEVSRLLDVPTSAA